MKKYRFHWLFGVLIVTVLCAALYKVGYLSLQSSLYDPLTTQAVDRAWQTALAAEKDGEVKADFLIRVDVGSQLTSFVTVYDENQKVVGSSGTLDGQTPTIPEDILDNTNQYVRNYFTWEPKPGVHLAGVAVSMGDYGYVLAARSMQETDRHIDRLTKTVVITWIASATLITAGLITVSRKR